MKEKNNEDLLYVRERAGTSRSALPEALAPQEITALVGGKKQKKHRRVVRAVVSAALAACLALTCTVVLRDTVVAPAVTRREIRRAGTSVSYEKLGAMIEKNRRADDFSLGLGGFRLGGTLKAAEDVDYVTAEEAGGDAVAVPNAAARDAAYAAESSNGYAETNVREAGVLESDIVKTDGKYLYVLSVGGRDLLILEPGTLTETARISLPTGETAFSDGASGFYLLGDRVALTGDGWDRDFGKRQTTLLLYDISDRAAPREARRLRFDGGLVSSRVTGDKLLLVTESTPGYDFDRDDYKTYVPAYNEAGGEPCYTPEDRVYLGGSESESCFTTVTLLDLSVDGAAPQSASVFGAAADLYCTADTLFTYAAVYPEYRYLDELIDLDQRAVTCIQRFDLTGDVPVLTASGRVEGCVLNTFSMDLFDGYLRVAAGDLNENRILVLDEALQEVGRSEALAEGEQIRSVRFMGDTAYVVTFIQTDPLFVLDLSDPAAPRVTGEVKLPGFSAYLHPAGEGYLLGVGYGGNESGLDGSGKVSLFDVRDPAAPKEVASVVLPQTNLDVDYKAFVSLGGDGFLIPYTTYEYRMGTDAYGNEYYSSVDYPGMLYITVANGVPTLKLDLRGEAFADRWVASARASFIGGSAYLISQDYNSVRVETFALENGAALNSATFQVETVSPTYYGLWDDVIEAEAETAVVEEAPTVVEEDPAAYDDGATTTRAPER